MNPLTRPILPAFILVLIGAAQVRCSSTTPITDASVDLPLSGDRPAIADPSLDLGAGQSAWEPMPDGSSVELIHGPQGGYHLFARIREQLLGNDVQVTFRVTPIDGGTAINDPSDRIRLLEGRGLLRTSLGWESTSALLVILTAVRSPSEVVGRRFVIEANVAPTGSSAATTVRRIITIVDET